MTIFELLAMISAGCWMLPMVVWVASLAGFVVHIPAVLIGSGFQGLRRLLLDHLRSVQMMFRRHLDFIRRKRPWQPKPPYPDQQYNRLALTSGLPASLLRSARYWLGLVLPGLVASAIFAALMGIVHVVQL